MNQPAQPIEADAFYASLRDRTANGVSTIAIDGGELPVSVRLRDSSTLVFSFTGAVDRSQHTLPRFASTSLYDYVPASIIGLSDPSLDRSVQLTLAWYAGHEGFELQKILPDVLRRMIDSLDATRVAFVGSSGGGFAALYYSWQIPGSVAIVSNPQTNLNRYFRAHRERYRAACWPSLDEDAPLDAVIDANLCRLYAKRCDNTVVYLQVASDFFHIRGHFAPFAAALPREHADRLIVRMANWGNQGHRPVPAAIWIPWMNAALSAPETTAASIEETWTEENPFQLPALEPLTRAAIEERPFQFPPLKPPTPAAGRDEQIAAELALAATNALLGPQSFERSPS
jgi:pimeloyl-ACP methyl ester carboxylesterase